MPLFATINGHRATTARLHVPYAGVWTAELELDAAVDLSGAVAVKLGALELRGAVFAPRTGTFGETTAVRVVAGAGGWARTVPAKHYHNDAGISVATVAVDTAQSVGEGLRAGASNLEEWFRKGREEDSRDPIRLSCVSRQSLAW
ncbi:uncharacterized protein SOCEGT47_038730 [Sorangium cellulosum]|uniref:Uncharacterized protein n=1 Tax=Sorangium cellulosum TaxID=56 RepID=A0A4P2Q283_SORCE|nr:uncharacterized protein SOCEGT47_038730 [Sorangium cellulosum]